MAKYRRHVADSTKGSRNRKKVPEREAATDSSESCRCKEVAKKTPREMLGLMIRDLAFWKKAKGNR